MNPSAGTALPEQEESTAPQQSAAQSDEATPLPIVSMIDQLLQEQQDLTAVEDFARCHSDGDLPAQAKYYQKLMPATPPKEGEQYGFEVNLDDCSGCKACVVACHSLNGLDEEETWRDVGLLIGGTSTLPIMQHVTTACHHCLDPACMVACPVNAYEKDPATGIVRHLDDQCFGCQYCTLACPYDVPKYHPQKGIVRKCDMCVDRLSAGEAPACVQACPHEAIAIRNVSIAQVRENAEVATFLPASPDSFITYPTTTYKTERVFPRNTLPADYYSVNPQKPHWPLIIMLVLTQLSVGAFTVGQLMPFAVGENLMDAFRPIQVILALLPGLLALGASTLHLGRPQYAFRAILGLRHSWLSREIVAFGLFAAAAAGFAMSAWTVAVPPVVRQVLGWTVVASGALGLFCSAMIYVFTQREFWNLSRTLTRFLLTAAILGPATSLLTLLLTSRFAGSEQSTELLRSVGTPLVTVVLVTSAMKLVWEAGIFLHLLQPRNSPLKRSARLLTGPLSSPALARFSLGLLGGIVMPAFLLLQAMGQGGDVEFTLQYMIIVAMLLAACLAGELMERFLFFAAVSAPKMPGGPRV